MKPTTTGVIMGIFLLCVVTCIGAAMWWGNVGDDLSDRTEWGFLKNAAKITISEKESKQEGRANNVGNSGLTIYSSDTVYRPVVSYDFTVDGKNYTGTEISPGGVGFMSLLDATRLNNKYAVGTTHDVYYMLTDPSRAYLMPSSRMSLLIPGSIISCLCTLAILMLTGVIKPKPSVRVPVAIPLSTTSSSGISLSFNI